MAMRSINSGSFREYFGANFGWTFLHETYRAANTGEGGASGGEVGTIYNGRPGKAPVQCLGTEWIGNPNNRLTLSDAAVPRDSFTHLVWVTPRAAGHRAILSHGSDFTGDGGWGYVLAISADALYVDVSAVTTVPGTASVGFTAYDDPRTLAIGVPVFIALVIDKTNVSIKLYINGRLKGSNLSAGHTLRGTSNNLIGVSHTNSTTWNFEFTGTIHRNGMTKRVLTPAQISDYYKWATRTPASQVFMSMSPSGGFLNRNYWWQRPSEQLAGV